MTYFDVSPVGTLEGDKAAVIAAALAAKNAGEETVRLENGHWLLDDLTPIDVHGRYLVMDKGTFSDGSFLYPFKPSDWVGGVRRQGNSGGRGRIAIEIDDSLSSHWRTLFPLAKKLGIPMSMAWHTDDQTAKWAHEAYRHGWELLSHLPYNIDARIALDEGILDDLAQQSLDAIREIVGPDKPVGFVYPMHHRNAATDEVLQKYYDRGRGTATLQHYSRDVSHDWQTAAFPLDTAVTESGASDRVLRILREISRIDGQAVFYMHWGWDSLETKGHAFIDFVRHAQSLGIEFVTSGQIWGDKNLVDDPYVQGEDWRTADNMAITSVDSYHGDNSIRFTESGGTPSHGKAYTYNRIPVPAKPGMYTRMKISFRMKNTAEVSFTSPASGLRPGGVPAYRKSDDSLTLGGLTPYIGDPDLGTTLPPSEWERRTYDIWLPPTVAEFSPGVSMLHMSSSEDVFFDDFRVAHTGYATEYIMTATLNGTANVRLYPPVALLGTRNYIHIEPASAMVGSLDARTVGTEMLLKSTSSADKMDIRIRITPPGILAYRRIADHGARHPRPSNRGG